LKKHFYQALALIRGVVDNSDNELSACADLLFSACLALDEALVAGALEGLLWY
jgi:hypothetical protein